MNQRVLSWVYLYPLNDIWWKKLPSFVFGLSAFSVLVSVVIMSVAFFLVFISTNLEAALFALLQIFACSAVAYEMICVFYLRHKIAALYRGLYFIYDLRKC